MHTGSSRSPSLNTARETPRPRRSIWARPEFPELGEWSRTCSRARTRSEFTLTDHGKAHLPQTSQVLFSPWHVGVTLLLQSKAWLQLAPLLLFHTDLTYCNQS